MNKIERIALHVVAILALAGLIVGQAKGRVRVSVQTPVADIIVEKDGDGPPQPQAAP